MTEYKNLYKLPVSKLPFAWTKWVFNSRRVASGQKCWSKFLRRRETCNIHAIICFHILKVMMSDKVADNFIH